jgi:5-methylcytosine-specific restriction endonuclease McrA
MIVNNKSLSSLSDSVFLRRLESFIYQERQVGLKIVRYLIEMDRRELYTKMGYSSLFDFCVRHLRCSESDANRKIKAARCIRDFPEVYAMLDKNELDLCKVALISNSLAKDNSSQLLSEVKYKSFRQIQEILARFNPGNLLRDKVRPVYLKKPAPTLPKPADDSHTTNNSDKKFTANVGGKKLASSLKTTAVLEKKYKLEFAVSPGVMAKIERARALLSNKYPKGVALEQLLDTLLDEYIDKHDPKCRQKRRERRKTKNSGAEKAVKKSVNRGHKTETNRHIPAAMRDKIHARDNGRCSYISPDGVKCDSSYNLQIDHIVPYAKGGDHCLSNLRLLCGKHNRLEAEKNFGREFVKNKISAADRPRRE